MFKFLDPTGCTYHDGQVFQYNLPQRGEKWSVWTEHPEPAEPDGSVCGPGRLHLMVKLNAEYAPRNWWPWWAEGKYFLGRDNEKASYEAVRLRKISPRTFARVLRPPFNWGCKTCLGRANLGGANLCEASLGKTNLCRAFLAGADLSGADLHEALLVGTNLTDANLSRTNLHKALLVGASLQGANLCNANLEEANLGEIDLREAIWNKFTIWPEGFDETKL